MLRTVSCCRLSVFQSLHPPRTSLLADWPSTPCQMRRRIHYAAGREVRSGNIAPFASRNLLVSLLNRLCLRTSRAAGLLRLAGAVAAVTLAATLTGGWSLLSGFALALALAVFFTSWRSLRPRKAWEDPSTVHINRLPTHSRLRNYSSFDQAANRDQESPNVVSLSGTWKFLLASGVSKAPAGFEHPGFPDSSWDDITVPGHWQLQDAGSKDPPIYTNTNYPFPNHPPYAPKTNPTGLYRRRFTLPEGWLELGGGGGRDNGPVDKGSVSPRLKGRAVLVFQGVDSAFHVWVNGLPVGFAKGSRLPCEFDVTDALRGTGEQSLSLRVVRWSDGSYLEDQDHWWLSGVYREVELALRPSPTRILDFVVRPFLSEDRDGAYTRGALEVEVLLEHDAIAPTPLGSPTSTGGRTTGSFLAPDPATNLKSSGRQRRRRESGESIDGEGDSRKGSFPLGEIESGEVGGWGGGHRSDTSTGGQATGLEPAEAGEVECTLVDTATGQRFPLGLAGALPDWQMGLPPAERRRQQHQQRQHQTSTITTGEVIGSKFSRFWPWSGLRSRNGRNSATRLGGPAVGDAAPGGRRPLPSPLFPAPPPSAKRSVRLFRLEVPGTTRAWSAEDPQLYTLVLRLSSKQRGPRGSGSDAEGEEEGLEDSSPPVFEQFESARVGFRSVVVSSGQLLVNGSAVMVAGVNRHEHDPDTGKTVSEASMRRDIVMMKRFNFNAVRNCHYPNHWRWYELCDELGLYVCDEANIETHGQIPLGRLSADPSWRLAYLDRVWRMLAANKNHACVILWSLGNESGDGENFTACRRLVKEVDPSRPVVYEGGGESLAEGCGCTELTDVVCPMYPTVERTEMLGKDGPDGAGETRPCVLCEYSHAMGNSNGNLHKYWELFRKHRRLQGGFIWDWVDQGLTKHDASTGRRYWADGGGFAGGHSKGYDAFCVNGVTFPDRSPHPALHEAKFLAQPVGVELLLPPDPSRSLPSHPSPDGSTTLSLRLRFTNRYGMSSLDHLSTQWRLRSSAAAMLLPDGTDPSLAGGQLSTALGALPPGESRELTVEVDRAALGVSRARGGHRPGGKREELFLHVEAGLAADSAWASRGHPVARGCFSVTELMPAEELPSPPPPPPPEGVAGAEQRDGGDGRETVAITTAEPSQGFILYGGEDDSARSSAEVSPQGQLRQHLLTTNPAPPISSSVIVMKGLLDHGSVMGGYEGGRATAAAAAAGEQLRFCREWTIVVSKAEGTVVRFVAGGVDLIEPGSAPSLSFWRAATDNDRAGWPSLLNFVADHRLVGFFAKFLPLSRLSHLERWNASGLSASDPPVFKTQDARVKRSSAQECLIKVKTSCTSRRRQAALFDITTEIRVSPGGSLEITTDVKPRKGVIRDSLSLARVGMMLKLPPGFGHVEWFGKGPFECYQDRKHGAITDVFSGSVEDQHVPYITPSENGGKADVRWMALRKGEGGAGLLMQAETGTVFEAASVSLHSASELHKAGRTVDLPERTSSDHPVFVHLDHRSMGVGGDNSWYPNVVHEEYTVPANEPHRFRVRLEALVPGAAAAPQAAAR